MIVDARGVRRQVVQVILDKLPSFDTKENVECITLQVRLRMDCGHVAEVNPSFTYRTGDHSYCLQCLKEAS